MNGHIVDTYEQEKSELDAVVALMGGLVKSLLWRAFRGLEHRNPRLAAEAVLADEAVDRIERSVQERAIEMIVKGRPQAENLRHAIAVLKIAAEIERVGDLSKNIARSASTTSRADPPRHILIGLKHLTELAAGQLKDVLDAWSTRDAGKALAVWRGDAALDALYSSVFRDILAWMMDDPRNIEHSAQLLFAAKNLERIGDHTTNIAEQIEFFVTGSAPPRDRQKRDDTSSLMQFEPSA